MTEFDKGKYDMQYAKENIKRKHIPFNVNNPEDRELLDYLESKENMTAYIKELIRRDMEKRGV